jgi:hypothetical protein
MPDPSLIAVAQMFFIPGMMATGKIQNPVTGRTEVNLEIAQYHIDLMQIILDKTKGNRTPEEDSTLEEMLDVLKMTFIEAKKA